MSVLAVNMAEPIAACAVRIAPVGAGFGGRAVNGELLIGGRRDHLSTGYAS